MIPGTYSKGERLWSSQGTALSGKYDAFLRILFLRGVDDIMLCEIVMNFIMIIRTGIINLL